MKHLIDEISVKQNDIAIASRYIKGGGYVNFPFFRSLYSKQANNLLKRFFPIRKVKDYTIFYRSYRVKVLREVMNFFGAYNFIHFRGFVSNPELLIKASCFTDRISEIPFMYDYGNKEGKSKLHVISGILEYIYFVFCMRRIIGQVKVAVNKQ